MRRVNEKNQREVFAIVWKTFDKDELRLPMPGRRPKPSNSSRPNTTSTLPTRGSGGPLLWGTGAGWEVRPLGQPSCHTHNYTVLADVNVRADLSCVDHTILLNEDVVPDVQREERDTTGR